MPGQNRKSKGRQGSRTYSVNARDDAPTPAASEGPPGLATGSANQAIVPNLQRSVSHQGQVGEPRYCSWGRWWNCSNNSLRLSMQDFDSPGRPELPDSAQDKSGWSPSPESSPDRTSSNQASLEDAAETTSNRSGMQLFLGYIYAVSQLQMQVSR